MEEVRLLDVQKRISTQHCGRSPPLGFSKKNFDTALWKKSANTNSNDNRTLGASARRPRPRPPAPPRSPRYICMCIYIYIYIFTYIYIYTYILFAILHYFLIYYITSCYNISCDSNHTMSWYSRVYNTIL